MTTKDIGTVGEKYAAKFLKKKGFRILHQNLHVSHNELDIIAANKELILFVEVKTRTSNPDQTYFGTPSSAVDRGKRMRTVEAAQAYLRSNPTKRQPRMDVIEVWLSPERLSLVSINHIENAFGVRA